MWDVNGGLGDTKAHARQKVCEDFGAFSTAGDVYVLLACDLIT